MRRIVREALDSVTETSLEARQLEADCARAAGTLDIASTWKAARRAKDVLAALAVLRRMAGPGERCMYCADSHGTDIEHFWPKTPYPERMFRWPNLLLCCTECGRFKGDRFPLDGGRPLLIDPTVEDPWGVLDFEPKTGIVMARFDRTTDRQSPRGAATVEVLKLNEREALSTQYKKIYRRLCDAVDRALAAGLPDPESLLSELRGLDDHGLLGWCLSERGRADGPFRSLYERHRACWDHCAGAITTS